MLSTKLQQALRWREEVAEGEMIESQNKTKQHLAFDFVYQDELDIICESANLFFRRMKSKLRIWNTMGELRPHTNRNPED